MSSARKNRFVRNLLQGMIAVRDEKREHQESLEGSDRPNVKLNEPTVHISEAVERSALSYEEGSEDEWAEAQRYLQNKGWVGLKGRADNSKVYARMEFTGDFAIDQARNFLEDA